MSDSLCPHGLYSSWNSPGQNTGMGSLSLLQGIFPTQGSNPGLPHYKQILYQLSHKRSPRIPEWVAYPFSRGSSWPRNQTGVSCIAVGFFTNWAMREALILPIHAYSHWYIVFLFRVFGPCNKFSLSDTSPHYAWNLTLALLALFSCQLSSAGRESSCSAGDLGSIPGLGRSPGEEKEYPLQYSGLENSVYCIIHGFTKSEHNWVTFTFTFCQLNTLQNSGIWW